MMIGLPVESQMYLNGGDGMTSNERLVMIMKVSEPLNVNMSCVCYRSIVNKE